MSILKRAHTNIGGLQDVCVIETGIASKLKNPWIQVFNSEGNHWLTATTIGCDKGVIKIYDSLYRRVSKALIQLLVKLTSWPNHEPMVIEMPRFQKQRNSYDCGLFSVACMMSLCDGQDPSVAKYDLRYLRSHLVKCLEKASLEKFPSYPGTIQTLRPEQFKYFICNLSSLITEYDTSPTMCRGCQAVL